ncbi:BrnA antitoxin family protein [Aurantimonas sp. MSK8Z-1]|uniref:BrnA antitoxin family protein n=1 Tax=Mangrovibrevibacter kandeliae TaxID=2968473 RepID=UPI00211895D9|nr:BrnA antitoxin family protein [Aurantimonas sp. MSK8Z-1]MCW4114022.1 BrnA antitoxin family protein [Aurantimonas sp. MSK8Z-1]
MIVTRKVIVKTTASPEDWAEAQEKTRRALLEMTPEEDAAITRDALSDPENPPLPEDVRLVPWVEHEARRREQSAVRIDRDVLERFQRAGDDWEERINAVLRAAAPAE